jgi:hypothetical protein
LWGFNFGKKSSWKKSRSLLFSVIEFSAALFLSKDLFLLNELVFSIH